MKSYQEITLLPNFEIDKNFLWSKLLTQIHLGLVSIQDYKEKSPIGVSFPEYFMGEKFGVLGSKIRLFAQNEDDLIKFDSPKWLSRLFDYVHITSILPVPQKIDGYAIYSRHQPKTNKERLMRRHQKREEGWKNIINFSADPKMVAEAREKLNKRQNRINDYDKKDKGLVGEPFIRVKSLSNKNEFCLWIKKTTTNEPAYQKFSTYGLSEFNKKELDLKKFSTVPEF